MSSWGNNDNSANAPLWAAMTENLAPTSTNISTSLYDNTTANNVAVTLDDGSVRNNNKQVGLFLVDQDEQQVLGQGAHPATPGWAKKTVGVGGRAGRVQWESLVALASVLTDGSDDAVLPDVTITLTQPTNQSITHGGGNVATLTVGVSTVPAYDTITYQWQYNNGTSWANVANGTPANTTYTGATTGALSILPTTTQANNSLYRVLVWAADTNIANSGGTATSANATVLVA